MRQDHRNGPVKADLGVAAEETFEIDANAGKKHLIYQKNRAMRDKVYNRD
jgi:hypothetical protein